MFERTENKDIKEGDLLLSFPRTFNSDVGKLYQARKDPRDHQKLLAYVVYAFGDSNIKRYRAVSVELRQWVRLTLVELGILRSELDRFIIQHSKELSEE